MKKYVLMLMILLGAATFCVADAKVVPRLTNGRRIVGQVVEPKEMGLAIKTERGVKVYPWRALSIGTRYRYEPGFTDLFHATMKNR